MIFRKLQSIILLACLIIFLIFTNTHSTFADSSLEPVSTQTQTHAVNYRIYYRSISPQILEDMKQLDMVILEALQLEGNMVSELKQSNTQIIGYISAIEVATWDESLNEKLTADELLHVDENLQFHGKNPLGDLRNPKFRQALLEIIDERIFGNTLDGIFIDSTSVLNDYFDDPIIGEGLLAGYVQLLEDIKTKHPHLKILQNRGFAYASRVAPYLDGLVWENFKSPRINDVKRYQRRIDAILELPEHIQIYTISYDHFSENENHAHELNWIHLSHSIGTSHSVWIPLNGI